MTEGFKESFVQTFMGGTFTLPKRDFKAVDLAELFDGWASEVRMWDTLGDDDITVEFGKDRIEATLTKGMTQ